MWQKKAGNANKIFLAMLGIAVTCTSILGSSISASGQGQHYYAQARGTTANPAAIQVAHTMVNSNVYDFVDGGLVTHAGWIILKNGVYDHWVEIGYIHGWYGHGSPSGGWGLDFYWFNGRPDSEGGNQWGYYGYGQAGTRHNYYIWWDNNQGSWQFALNDVLIGAAGNYGPWESWQLQAGLETTAAQSTSDYSDTYNMRFATVANWTWRNWDADGGTVIGRYDPGINLWYWWNQPSYGGNSQP